MWAARVAGLPAVAGRFCDPSRLAASGAEGERSGRSPCRPSLRSLRQLGSLILCWVALPRLDASQKSPWCDLRETPDPGYPLALADEGATRKSSEHLLSSRAEAGRSLAGPVCHLERRPGAARTESRDLRRSVPSAPLRSLDALRLLGMTRSAPHLGMTRSAPHLGMTECAPHLGMTKNAPRLRMTKSAPHLPEGGGWERGWKGSP